MKPEIGLDNTTCVLFEFVTGDVSKCNFGVNEGVKPEGTLCKMPK